MTGLRRSWRAGPMLALALVALPALADGKGDSLLRQALQTLHGAQTLAAEITVVTRRPGRGSVTHKGSVSLMKPNFLRVKVPGYAVYAADGKSYFVLDEVRKRYVKEPLDRAPAMINGQWNAEVDGFFGGVKLARSLSATHQGTERVGSTLCDLVKAQPKGARYSYTYAIGQKDHLIYRTTVTVPGAGGHAATRTITLHGIRLNEPRKAAEFAFRPPAGAKLYERPDDDATLLAVGATAPDFDLPTPDGGRLKLSQARRGKKVVVVTFWFYG